MSDTDRLASFVRYLRWSKPNHALIKGSDTWETGDPPFSSATIVVLIVYAAVLEFIRHEESCDFPRRLKLHVFGG